MDKKKLEEIIAKNQVVIMVKEILKDNYYNSLSLVGGAVLDIIERKTPKDYDFIYGSDSIIEKFLKNGFKFIQTTKSATTLKKGKIIIQFINTPLANFDFKISQTRYDIKRGYLEIDKISYKYKTLIPVNFEDFRNAINSLRRIPHWRKKGYNIKDLTYLSLLNVISKKRPIGS